MHSAQHNHPHGVHNIGIVTDLIARLADPAQDHPRHAAEADVHARHAPHPLHIRGAIVAPGQCVGRRPDVPGRVGLVAGAARAFGFLFEIRKRFLAEFDEASTDFADLPNYGAASVNATLKGLMVDYGTTSGGRDDAITNVQREMDDVRGIMTRNIEGLLERGERIDLLVDKTDRLGGSAREFRVRSRGLKRQMWWKNVKLMALLVVVLALIVLTIVLAIKNATG